MRKKRRILQIALGLGIIALFLLLRRSGETQRIKKFSVSAEAEAIDVPRSIERVPRQIIPLAKPPKTSKRANAAIVMLVR
jgi:hypothetical protein